MPTLLLRWAMRGAYRLRRALFQMLGYRPSGVHAIVLTPAAMLVLVRLTYAPGWHLPGGGRGRRETPEAGVLRELREEIGLQGWTALELLHEWHRSDGGRRDHDALFVVRNAAYRPRRSLEIAAVATFPRDRLPPDLSPWARSAIARYLPAG